MTAPSERTGKIKRLNRLTAKIYPSQFISELATEFEITKRAEVSVLQKLLRLAACVYLEQKDDELHEPKIRDLNAELAAIKTGAKDLENTLNSLSETVTQLLWSPLRFVPSEIYLNPEVSEYYGYPITRHIVDDTKKSIKFPNEYQIQKAIQLLSKLADDALTRVIPDKGGRPTSQALRIWVINMQRLWEKELSRPFTHYQHHGSPVSSAFLFCQKTLRPLDASISTTLLGTTVRAVIKETPKALRVSRRKKPS